MSVFMFLCVQHDNPKVITQLGVSLIHLKGVVGFSGIKAALPSGDVFIF